MNTRTLMTAFFISLSAIAQNANALIDYIPPISFDCHSVDPSDSVEIKGQFEEEINRHGAGQIEFTLTTPGTQLQKTGKGHTWSDGEISYSDESMEIEFENANYHAQNISELKMNGETTAMTCQFTSPASGSSNCHSFGCHHPNH